MLIIKQLIDYCFEPVALVYLDHTGDKNKSNKHIVPDILKQEEKAMQVKIGNKIKELRKRDGRKQEDLANAFGVTCQAVSRWESDSCYPDMSLIL